MSLLVQIIALAVAIILLYLLIRLLKAALWLIVNSVAGIIVLLLVNFVFGFGIPLNIFTVLIVALAGLPGLALILILHFLGIAF